MNYEIEIALKSGPSIRIRSERPIEAKQSWTKVKTGNLVVHTKKHWLRIVWKDVRDNKRTWLFDMDDVEQYSTKSGEELLK